MNILTVVVCVVAVAGCGRAQLVQYSFKYTEGDNSRFESLDAFGKVQGAFNYLDSRGQINTRYYNYVLDQYPAVNFVEPEYTLVPEVPPVEEPLPTQDTVEPVEEPTFTQDTLEPVENTDEVPEDTTELPVDVVEPAAQDTESDTTAAEAATSPDLRQKRSVVATSTFAAYSPLRFSYGFSAPLPYAAVASHLPHTVATTYTAAAVPATVRDAQLLRVVHNPGYGVSYRVY